MKAIYQKPATEIVVLSTGAHLMDTSNGLLGNGEVEVRRVDHLAGIDLDPQVTHVGLEEIKVFTAIGLVVLNPC